VTQVDNRLQDFTPVTSCQKLSRDVSHSKDAANRDHVTKGHNESENVSDRHVRFRHALSSEVCTK
jgi:hypothetical protein